MIYLGKESICGSVSREELLDEVENTLLQQEVGDFLMPPRSHIGSEENAFLLMPCLTKSFFGTKLVSVFPDNARQNLPSVDAVMILSNATTGEILAILDGQTLTTLRTGAVGGVGIRHLSLPDVESLGIVGTGVQGLSQALFAASVRPIKEINVFGRRPEAAATLFEKLSLELPGIRIRATTKIESLLESSQVVITATSSAVPVLPNEEALLKGKLFVGIGSYTPNMREFPEALYNLANSIFVDTSHATEESGDLVEPLLKEWITRGQVNTLGQFMLRDSCGAGFLRETRVFKSVGMALFDVNIAGLIYKKALEKGLGLRLQ